MTDPTHRFPCGECGQMVLPRQRHTYEDCLRWKAGRRDVTAKGLSLLFRCNVCNSTVRAGEPIDSTLVHGHHKDCGWLAAHRIEVHNERDDVEGILFRLAEAIETYSNDRFTEWPEYNEAVKYFMRSRSNE